MIKILFLAANPSDTAKLQLAEEVKAIDMALRTAQYREYFELKSYQAVRIEDLQESLLRFQPHIVHFSGHGSADGEIILHDHSNQSVSVPVVALSLLFGTLKDNIRCVVLNCCYSIIQAEAIAEHIDCVIGISDAITDVASRFFASSFYQALAYGRTVEESYSLGTIQLALHGLAEEDKPHLLGASDPKLVLLVDPDKVDKAKLSDPALIANLNLPVNVYHTGREEPLPVVSTPRVGKLPHSLTEQEIIEFLDKHSEWSVLDTKDSNAFEGVRRELYRVYEFPSYRMAFKFMNQTSEQAICVQNHHPRWQNTWNRVELWLTTFNTGYRISTKDRRLAEQIEQIWREFKKSIEW